MVLGEARPPKGPGSGPSAGVDGDCLQAIVEDVCLQLELGRTPTEGIGERRESNGGIVSKPTGAASETPRRAGTWNAVLWRS